MEMKQVKFSIAHCILLGVQLVGSIFIYLFLSPLNESLAQGLLICALVPTGTAAAVVTGMLGGNVASLTAYSLLCNLAIAFAAPIVFSYIGVNTVMPFWKSVWMIAEHVGFLLLVPFVLSWLLSEYLPKIASFIGSYSSLAFYIWIAGILIISGRIVDFVLSQQIQNLWLEITIAIATFVLCVLQFVVGRRIGRSFNDTVASGQGLAQKNTILAIWMAQLYLNPIASIAPGAYVISQNIVNSFQIWRSRQSAR
jgi:BASS family bile acid:Na+ symporter